MRNENILKVELLDEVTEQFVDVTSGILSINTFTGNDIFQGFWDQPDVGQFSIVSRGSVLDPNVHSNVKTNALISVKLKKPDKPEADYLDEFMTGLITDVQVEYIKGEKPIVTINCVDLLGYLNRVVVTQEFIDSEVLPDYPNSIVPISVLMQGIYQLSEPIYNYFNLGFASLEQTYLGTGSEPNPFTTDVPEPLIKVEAGKSFYELITSSMSYGLSKFIQQFSNVFNFCPNSKYDYYYYAMSNQNSYSTNPFLSTSGIDALQYAFLTNETDTIQDAGYASTNPIPLTFRSISLNNGINKIINQVATTTTNLTTAQPVAIDPLINQTSVETYGPARLESTTEYATTKNPFVLSSSTIAGQVEEYQNNILDYQSLPKPKIESITLDLPTIFKSEDVSDIGSMLLLGKAIYVQHKVDEDNYIYGFYEIAGIRSAITNSEINIELILKQFEFDFLKDKKPRIPEIQLSALSGNANTSFSASITNYTNTELDALTRIEWQVNLPYFYVGSYPPSQLKSGNIGYSWGDLSNIQTITGKTPSWTYSDLGVLANYPEQLRGPGIYNVAVWVTNAEGYTSVGHLITTEQDLIDTANYVSVVGAVAHADFIVNVNEYGVVTITDTSGPDTTTWTWDFGDGTTYSGEFPPPKTYASPDTYDITLTVFNGSTTDHKTIPVTITEALLPVRYVKLRFQGSVTRPAGQSTYSTDLIDTIGALRLKNTSNVDTGGSNPFYLNVRTLDKVELVANERSVIPPGDPIITTNFNDSRFNPMSQSAWGSWSMNPNNLSGAAVAKYKFHPVITNNPNGSQTKTYDFDLIFEYSQIYNSEQRVPYYVGSQPSIRSLGTTVLGGTPANLSYWVQWGPGGSSSYDQRYKLAQILPYAPVLFSDAYGTQGTATGKTYLPVQLSVSPDGVTYRTVGSAAFTGPGAATSTYSVSMPPKNTAPIQT